MRSAGAVNVLYIHHAGAYGGASRSLLELIRGFPAGAVNARLVTQHGTVPRVMSQAGVEVLATRGISQFDHTRFSHYRGRRWLLLARELGFLPFTAMALLRARFRWRDIDLVHVNDITVLPAALLARAILKRPVILHVRAVQRTPHAGARSALLKWALQRRVDAVVAIDETVRRSLPPGVANVVIHNAYTPERQPSDDSRPRFGEIPQLPLRVGMIGDLLAFKGVREFVEAARICRERRLNVKFMLVGARGRPARGVFGLILGALGFLHHADEDVRHLVEEHRLGDIVKIENHTSDIAAVYRELDVLCFPSHLDAPGRPVFEAASWCIPSIVSLTRPEPDTFVPGETGLAISAGDPVAIADAVEYFHARPEELRRMGENARSLAQRNFNARSNALLMLEVYRTVLATRQRRS